MKANLVPVVASLVASHGRIPKKLAKTFTVPIIGRELDPIEREICLISKIAVRGLKMT